MDDLLASIAEINNAMLYLPEQANKSVWQIEQLTDNVESRLINIHNSAKQAEFDSYLTILKQNRIKLFQTARLKYRFKDSTVISNIALIFSKKISSLSCEIELTALDKHKLTVRFTSFMNTLKKLLSESIAHDNQIDLILQSNKPAPVICQDLIQYLSLIN